MVFVGLRLVALDVQQTMTAQRSPRAKNLIGVSPAQGRKTRGDLNHHPPDPEVQSLPSHQVTVCLVLSKSAPIVLCKLLLKFIQVAFVSFKSIKFFFSSKSCIKLQTHFITNNLLKIFFFICRFCQKAGFCLGQSGESPAQNKETGTGRPAGRRTNP